MSELSREVRKYCKGFGSVVTELLPENIGSDAKREIQAFCLKISKEIDQKGKDVESLISGEFTKISPETMKELAGIAKKAGEKYSSVLPTAGGASPGKASSNLDAMFYVPGKQVTLTTKIASGLNISLLINVSTKDPLAIISGKKKLSLHAFGIGSTCQIDKSKQVKIQYLKANSSKHEHMIGVFFEYDF